MSKQAAASEPEPEQADADSRAPLAFVAELTAFNEDELRRALNFLQLYDSEPSISEASVSSGAQSFTPVSLTALPHGIAPEIASAELRWLTRKMLAIAVRADRKGGWGYTATSTLAASDDHIDVCCLEPSDELIYNRFGTNFSDTTFSWHKDDSEPGPRDISVVLYFTGPTEFDGGELQLKCDTSLSRLPAQADYGGKSFR